MQFVVDARIRFEAIRPRAAAGDDFGLQAGRMQSFDDVFNQSDRVVELGAAVAVTLQMLHGALVGLDAAELLC